uniref:Uncharacterized protein n=1 Tax=Oryza glumipatula TaxID=40148 RepID=A0A0D9YP86_9ORYZ
MASPAITILAMSLLLLPPPLALGSLAGGDQRRKEPWIATIYPGDGGRNPPVSPARDRPGTEA